MNLRDLELTLADIESQLLHRKCDYLESELEEASLASDGAKITGPQAGGGINGGPEAYAGYTVGNEGDIHRDGGGTDSAQAERSKTLRATLRGGPGDTLPQTQAGKAAAAQAYNRKDRDNQGDVDHSGFQSGA